MSAQSVEALIYTMPNENVVNREATPQMVELTLVPQPRTPDHDTFAGKSALQEDDRLVAAWEDLTSEQADLYISAIGLAKKIAKRYAWAGLTYPEAVQEAHLGLHDAALRYDVSRGAKFTTYAATRVKGYMIDQIRLVSPLARSDAKQVRQVHDLREAGLSNDEIVQELGISMEQLTESQHRFKQQYVASLDELVDVEAAGYNSMLAGAAQGVEESRYEEVERELSLSQVSVALDNALGKIPANQRDIAIFLRHTQGEKLHSLGEEHGLTESRAGQICKQVGKLIRNYLEASGQAEDVYLALVG